MARGSLGTFGEPGIGKGRIVHKESKRVKSPQSPSQGLAFGESEPPGAEAGCNSRPSASSSLGSVGLSCQRALSTDCTVQVGSSRVAPWTGHRPDIDSARLRVEFSVECRHRVLLCQLRRCSGWVKGQGCWQGVQKRPCGTANAAVNTNPQAWCKPNEVHDQHHASSRNTE